MHSDWEKSTFSINIDDSFGFQASLHFGNFADALYFGSILNTQSWTGFSSKSVF